MKLFFLIATIVLISSCDSPNERIETYYNNPYEEINAYFEKMGLTRKGQPIRELKAAKKEIMVGLKEVYAKWGLDLDINSPLTDEMIVCPLIYSPDKCLTWVW